MQKAFLLGHVESRAGKLVFFAAYEVYMGLDRIGYPTVGSVESRKVGILDNRVVSQFLSNELRIATDLGHETECNPG